MGRKLRVDFSNEGGAGGDDSGRNNDRDNANNSYAQNNNNNNNNYNPPPPNGNDAQSAGGALPPLPPGRDLPPGVTCTDAISRTLNTLPPAQLLDILSSMKQLATTDPARATELLNQAPQLSYAVFQALLLMGLVSPDAINAVLEPGSNPAAAPAPGGYPPPLAQQQPGGFPGVGVTNTPPVAAPTPYAPPPVAAAAPPPAAIPAGGPASAFGGAAPGQNPDDLIQQVLSLPEEVIAQLPEAEKQTILQLRAQYSGQRM
jgi:cleavage stimulation factor subunit 2